MKKKRSRKQDIGIGIYVLIKSLINKMTIKHQFGEW